MLLFYLWAVTVLNNFYWSSDTGSDSSIVYRLLCRGKKDQFFKLKIMSHVECVFTEDSDVERDLRNKDLYVFLCVGLLLNISFQS